MNKIAAVILCSFVALFCVDLVISDVSHLNPSGNADFSFHVVVFFLNSFGRF